MSAEKGKPDYRELATDIRKMFLIFSVENFLEPFDKYLDENFPYRNCVGAASDGLRSVVSAAELPFKLTQASVLQRKFDQLHSAERILGLIPEKPGAGLSSSGEQIAFETADQKMANFLKDHEGQAYLQDQVLLAMSFHLKSESVRLASEELLVQTLISTWSIFESFSRSFVIDWLNDSPERASSILESSDLKEMIGKKVVDFETIGEHGFDLSSSMGTILFKHRRLDSLASIRSVMKALFNSRNIQSSLGDEMWSLNQRRHLFVHNRGLVDATYLKQTSETLPIGERLVLNCDDIERHLIAVRTAIVAICGAAFDEIKNL